MLKATNKRWHTQGTILSGLPSELPARRYGKLRADLYPMGLFVKVTDVFQHRKQFHVLTIDIEHKNPIRINVYVRVKGELIPISFMADTEYLQQDGLTLLLRKSNSVRAVMPMRYWSDEWVIHIMPFVDEDSNWIDEKRKDWKVCINYLNIAWNRKVYNEA